MDYKHGIHGGFHNGWHMKHGSWMGIDMWKKHVVDWEVKMVLPMERGGLSI